MLKKFHNYPKYNYKQEHVEFEKEYSEWQKRFTDSKQSFTYTDYRSNYQIGYNQAIRDYQSNCFFHQCPKTLIKFGNTLFDDKLSELSEFITGYEEANNNIINKLESNDLPEK